MNERMVELVKLICPLRPARAQRCFPDGRPCTFCFSPAACSPGTHFTCRRTTLCVTPVELVPLREAGSFQLNGRKKTLLALQVVIYPEPFFYPFKGPSGSA